MFRIRKSFKFEAAHQLESAFSKDCVDTIHGHSYKVELFITRKTLNDDRMVLDFGQLKSFIEEVKEEWDHALFISTKTFEKYSDLSQNSRKLIVTGGNPTAETMAYLLFNKFAMRIEGSRLEKVRVHETDSGWAEYEGEGLPNEQREPK